jgi:hypothetical protein
MKLDYVGKNRPHAKDRVVDGKYIRGKRFYTSVDMAIIKHDIAAHNSMINRKKVEKKGRYLIYECGCGGEGCFLHVEIN